MSIEAVHLKDGVSYRAIVRIGRKKVSKAFPTKREAKQWEMEMRVMGKNSPYFAKPKPTAVTLTLNQLMTRFELEHGLIQNAFSTRLQNRNLYNKYLDKQLGDTLVTALSAEKIRTYFLHLKNDRNIHNSRINRIRQLLHSLYNRAIEWELIEFNPLSRIKKFPCRDVLGSDEIRFLTKSEADVFLEWLRTNDPWFYPKAVVLLHTGIRFGEMAALRVEDVRISGANPHLRISRTRCRHSGEFRVPKGKRARMLPLSDGLIGFLKPLVEGRKGDEPLLWKSWDEGRWNTKSSDHFLRAIKCSGVTRVRIHDLRHTFAVRFLENGGHIYALKEILGHQDIRITMRYSHFSPQMAEQARGIVDFQKPTPKLAVIDGGLR